MGIVKNLIFSILVMLVIFSIVPFNVVVAYDCASNDHDYIIISVIEPTKDKNGYNEYECRICGNTYREVTALCKGLWGDWIIDIEPTCTQAGKKHRVCPENSAHIEYDNISPIGHEFEEKEKKLYCDKDGEVIFACKNCGEEYSEKAEERVAHIFETKKTPATYTSDGKIENVCKVCGYTEEELLERLNHEHSYVSEIVLEATCMKEGILSHTCDICDERYEEAIKVLEHDFGDWIVRENPTLTTEGVKYRECNRDCGHIEEESIGRGITADVTPADAVINLMNLAMLGLSGSMLLSARRIISWDKKLRAKNIKGWYKKL